MTRRKESRDFSKGRRGAVVPVPHGKTRITIRIGTDVLDWFREQVNAAGGGNYQTSMNDVLRRHVEGREELQVPASAGRDVGTRPCRRGLFRRAPRGGRGTPA